MSFSNIAWLNGGHSCARDIIAKSMFTFHTNLLKPLHQEMKEADPEKLFQKLDRIGKGSFGEVFQG